ncbi:MAG: uracil-DNA glycosylase [Candidatus Kryptoniota bacterium]
MKNSLAHLNLDIISCRKCPRLVEWREKIAQEKRRQYRDDEYWGKPVPGFGDSNAKLLIVGLAPAAHGANRTGRMFTGDRSGEWLYGTLHKFLFSNRQISSSANDDLELIDCYVTAVVRCAPPANKPLKHEINNCQQYLLRELQFFKNLKVIVALGKIAFDSTVHSLEELGIARFEKRPKFGHGAKFKINEEVTLLASYHPSQQNTFTGKLTKPMFEMIFKAASALTK